MKIQGTNKDSVCVHCNSKVYGRTCPYGPKKTHCHTDDPARCIWCGSTIIGPGCPFNPFGNYHQRGYAVNTLALEAFEDGIVHGVIMKRLSSPLSETTAFKIGLIDDNGNVLREPKTIEERNALTGSDKYLIKIRNLVKNNIDLLNTTLYFENKDEYDLEELKKMYPIESDCKFEIDESVGKLFKIVESFTRQGVKSSKIEQLLAEAILNVKANGEFNQTEL